MTEQLLQIEKLKILVKESYLDGFKEGVNFDQKTFDPIASELLQWGNSDSFEKLSKT